MSKKKQHSFIYGTLEPVVRFAVNIFYRKFKTSGLQNVPKDRALIFVANHQNALMDPLLCCVTAPEQIGYLARADVFKNPKIAKLLYSIHMLPVYRAHDNVKDQRGQNAAVFKKCFEKLKRRNAIALFPEGNHNNQRKLRTLRKGVARIALGSQEDERFPLSIVPVGIHYANFDKFRSDALVLYGEPIDIAEYVNEQDVHSPKAQMALMNRIREGISDRMIDLENGDDTTNADQLARVLFASSSNGKPRTVDVNLQFSLFKSIERLVNDDRRRNEWMPLLTRWNEHAEDWRAWIIAREIHGSFPIAGWLLFLFIGAPLTLAGLVLNFIPYLLVDRLTPHLIEDEQFVSSIKLLLGIILFPLAWVLLAWLGTNWLGSWAWLSIPFALPLGLFGMLYVKKGEYLKRSIKWLRWKGKNPKSAEQVKRDFNALSELLYDNYVGV